ncbi:flavin-containing monooxygenase [Nocardia farcinica]|uniref:flavin-containing monooxygenase n=1 Tax=Nocardia farcinica TaxID=37329 RepID=UPI003D78BA90
MNRRGAVFHFSMPGDPAAGAGGTWHWNTYPGVAVDIPSFSYQFSFAQRDDWSRVYAPGRELKAYAEWCVEKYRLRPHIRFQTTVTAAEFDERAHVWIVHTADGSRLRARFVISGTGALTRPKLPDIPGVADFGGATMHTARWNHHLDLRGKRVAIIGTGASAVQIIPEIAPKVAHLTVFQRTPIWCLPRPDAPLPAPVRMALRLPGGKSLTRLASQTYVELTFPLSAHYHDTLPTTAVGERLGHAHLRRQVHDPVVRDELTPRYPLGCKRPSFSNDYLATYNRANVTLETDPIAEITRSGLRTATGTDHRADVLILATGFKLMEAGEMPTYRLTGVGGRDLEQWWNENRLQAYEGVSIPGFPNFFSIIGPYGYNGSSYFALIENQVRHIVRCLRHARANDATAIEVTAEANDRFFREMLARRGGQVFWEPGCATANSYYFDKHGDVPLRPSTTLEAAWRSGHFDLNDYRLARLG